MGAQDTALDRLWFRLVKKFVFLPYKCQTSIMYTAPPDQVARKPRVKRERTESCIGLCHSTTKHEQCQVKEFMVLNKQCTYEL